MGRFSQRVKFNFGTKSNLNFVLQFAFLSQTGKERNGSAFILFFLSRKKKQKADLGKASNVYHFSIK